jgi:hypothetical protein
MRDDDLITGLQASVKMEVVELYLRERRIIEEEVSMVFEASADYHHKVAEWRRNRDLMMTALITPEDGERFSSLTRLAPYESCLCFEICLFEKPNGAFTRFGRYRRLIEGLYAEIYNLALEVAKARLRLADLLNEVNDDIRRFELNHDLMSINQYLRSMSPEKLLKRKILGVNYTAKETALAAQALSFRPIAIEILSLDNQVDPLVPPNEAFMKTKPLLKEICRKHPKEVDTLFIRG